MEITVALSAKGSQKFKSVGRLGHLEEVPVLASDFRGLLEQGGGAVPWERMQKGPIRCQRHCPHNNLPLMPYKHLLNTPKTSCIISSLLLATALEWLFLSVSASDISRHLVSGYYPLFFSPLPIPLPVQGDQTPWLLFLSVSR